MIWKPIAEMTKAERQEYNNHKLVQRMAKKGINVPTNSTILKFEIHGCSDELRDLIIAAIKSSEGK